MGVYEYLLLVVLCCLLFAVVFGAVLLAIGSEDLWEEYSPNEGDYIWDKEREEVCLVRSRRVLRGVGWVPLPYPITVYVVEFFTDSGLSYTTELGDGFMKSRAEKIHERPLWKLIFDRIRLGDCFKDDNGTKWFVREIRKQWVKCVASKDDLSVSRMIPYQKLPPRYDHKKDDPYYNSDEYKRKKEEVRWNVFLHVWIIALSSFWCWLILMTL